MPRYYRVSPALWNEPWDDDMRLLALYLLTSPHRTTEGLYRLPRPYIEADLGWGAKRIGTTLDELRAEDFIKYEGDVVLIINALKYQAPQNPNGVTAAVNALEGVPATVLDTEFLSLAERYCQPLAQQLRERLPKRFGQSLALAPSPTHSSSPSTTVDDGVDEAERLRQHLEGKGKHDLEDVTTVADRYRNRLAFGASITDPVAWAEAILSKLQAARQAVFKDAGPRRIEVDGERFELNDAGTWELVA